MFRFLRKRRRKRLASIAFPPDWLNILIRNFPLYPRLPTADQQELQKHIQIFLSEKQLEGCGGLHITQEMKVTIAAQACLLLLHRETDYYPWVSSILVYPAAFVAPFEEHSGHWLVTEGEDVLDGEAWQEGTVVLSWKDARSGAADIDDGSNLVLHEFAHQLDMEDNADDGVPVLPRHSMYADWARIMGAEYERLQSDVDNDRTTVMDTYGASSPAEFFAVATESFFEKPVKLRKAHPQLYQLLMEFYQQDPALYFNENQVKTKKRT